MTLLTKLATWLVEHDRICNIFFDEPKFLREVKISAREIIDMPLSGNTHRKAHDVWSSVIAVNVKGSSYTRQIVLNDYSDLRTLVLRDIINIRAKGRPSNTTS